MRTIHVACQSTSQFAPDCAVMLRSLLAQNPSEELIVHFLYGENISSGDRNRLAEIVTGLGASWEPVRVPDSLLAGLPAMERYGGLTVWFRLLLPRLLADLDRVLYLDADLLVLEPVRPLWETELAGGCLAAATQPLIGVDKRRVTRDLGLPDPRRYFNTGVMVMDLDRLRSTGLMLEAERVPRERGRPVPWADQDSLNVALWDQRIDLHPRWNVMNPCFELPARYLPWRPEEILAATTHPAIVHFIGPYKPWHYRLRHPYADRYFAHLEQTPWRGRRIREGRSLRHGVLRKLPPYAAWRYEQAEYALRRTAPVPGRTIRGLAKRVLSRRRRLYGWARAAYRLARPRSAPEPLTDILDAFADSTPDACFLQIGAGDADYGDPLCRYVARAGWRGTMVEPVPYLFDRLRSRYAGSERITLVNAAITEADGKVPFYYLAQSDDPGLPEWYDKLGSLAIENILHPYHVRNIPDLAERVVCEQVRGSTFETLWRTNPLPRLDLLLVDAEGQDDRILSQIDFERHRPAIVIYERQHLTDDRRAALQERLSTHGYRVLDLGPDALAVRHDGPLTVRLAMRRHRRRWRRPSAPNSGSSRRRLVPSGRL
jgi:FkbM family methyltransferase